MNDLGEFAPVWSIYFQIIENNSMNSNVFHSCRKYIFSISLIMKMAICSSRLPALVREKSRNKIWLILAIFLTLCPKHLAIIKCWKRTVSIIVLSDIKHFKSKAFSLRNSGTYTNNKEKQKRAKIFPEKREL